jgi:hypothetical protein
MQIIGLIGKKQSGKDEFCKHLAKLTTVRRLAFGDALKREVASGCRVSVDYINEHKPAFRLILQGWGTDFRRGLFGEDYWVKQLPPFNPYALNVVTDVRFENEVQLIKRSGGLLLRIERRGLSTDLHPSETSVDDVEVDYIVENHGTLVEFYAAVESFFHDYVSSFNEFHEGSTTLNNV